MRAFVLVLVACSAPPRAATSQLQPAHAVLPDVAFDELDGAQRAAFMKERVMPAMEPVFRGHVGALACETCHGKPVDGRFRMPNPELPKLGDDLSHFKREDVEWMAREVKPAMAKLLGRAEASDSLPRGFGCSVCHTLEP